MKLWLSLLRNQIQFVTHAAGYLQLLWGYQLAEKLALSQAEDEILHLEGEEETGYKLAFLEGLADKAGKFC